MLETSSGNFVIYYDQSMGHFSSNPGAIYLTLQRLEVGGLIKGTVEGGDMLRPGRVYTLTGEGKAALGQ